jgi:hypothetical protein
MVKARIGQQLIREIKAGEVADLGENHSTHAGANAGDVVIGECSSSIIC